MTTTNDSQSCARAALADVFHYLSSADAFWFVINTEANHHGFSLYNRLGFIDEKDYVSLLVAANLATIEVDGSVRVLAKEWESYLNSGYFVYHQHKPRFNKQRTDLDASVNATQFNRNNRQYWYSIRIGRDESKLACDSLTKQIDSRGRLIQKPPQINYLAKRRQFRREIEPVIIDTIISNSRLFDKYMVDDSPPHQPKRNDFEQALPIVSPRPSKKPKQSIEQPSPDPTPVVISIQQQKEESTVTVEDKSKYPLLTKCKNYFGDEWSDRSEELLFLELSRKLKRNHSIQVIDDRMHDQTWIHVPVNDSEYSHRKNAKEWLGRALEVNGKNVGIDEAAKRACSYLVRHYKEAVIVALKDSDILLVETMNETKIAAMWEAAHVNGTQEEVISKHLRSHFGKKALVPRNKVRMLSNGHSEVMTGKVSHAYSEGEVEEIVEFSYKNVAIEIENRVQSEIASRVKDVSNIVIHRVDLIAGGDHGKGAFQAGFKVVIKLSHLGTDSTIIFDIGVAEVICRKDTASLLKKTIEPHLTSGLKTITENDLQIGIDELGKVRCCFGAGEDLKSKITTKANVYIVGDLAFYAMVLGRESSSPFHCYLCRLSSSQFSTAGVGEEWTYELMNKLVGEMKNGKPLDGCKEEAWFQMVPLPNYLVPPLHVMIGVGNDIFDNFRDVVNEKVECLDEKEVQTCRKVHQCEDAIADGVVRRNNWDKSEKGKRLKSLQAMVKRRRKALECFDVGFSQLEGGTSARSTNDHIYRLFEEIDEFMQNDESDSDDDEMTSLSYPNQPPANNNPIEQHRSIISEMERELKILKEERQKLSNKVTRGRSYLAKLKQKLTEFRSTRKRKEDGLESKMLKILRGIGVELTRYHGGSLAGMDIKKVIANCTHVFDSFATLLKINKKEDSPLTDEDIETLCFATARTIDPTENDIARYKSFVNAAVDCHMNLGLNVTHKVHLAWRHIENQMRLVPGGLGEKGEDWVELQHQRGSRDRKRFSTIKDIDLRAHARAKTEHHGMNSDVMAIIASVNEDAARKFISIKKSKANVQKEAREQQRNEALSSYQMEKKSEHIKNQQCKQT